MQLFSSQAHGSRQATVIYEKLISRTQSKPFGWRLASRLFRGRRGGGFTGGVPNQDRAKARRGPGMGLSAHGSGLHPEEHANASKDENKQPPEHSTDVRRLAAAATDRAIRTALVSSTPRAFGGKYWRLRTAVPGRPSAVPAWPRTGNPVRPAVQHLCCIHNPLETGWNTLC